MELGNKTPRASYRTAPLAAGWLILSLLSCTERPPAFESPIHESWVEIDGKRTTDVVAQSRVESVRGIKYTLKVEKAGGAHSVRVVLRGPVVTAMQDFGRWIEMGESLFAFPSGVESVTASPGSDRIELTLFAADNHPLRLQKRCYESSLAVRPKEARRAPAPESLPEASFWILPSKSAQPLAISRLPYGYRGAFVFSDHADQSSLERLRALGHAFTSRGLVFTKTIFNRAAPHYFAQGHYQPYINLARQLQRAGIEIGIHSPSGVSDRPDAVSLALRDFRQDFSGKTWIDHQPDTNCEAVTNQGWDPSSSWYIADRLKQHGFQYVWAGEDQALGSTLGLPRPFWQHPDLPGLTLFASAWAYLSPKGLAQRYTLPRLQELARTRGVHIAHTYLDTFQQTGPHASLSLLANDQSGYTLSSELTVLLDRLKMLQMRRDLWVTTVERLGEAYAASGLVKMEPAAGGRIRLTSGQPIQGLTILVVNDRGELIVDGNRLSGHIGPDRMREYWFDLPKTVVLEWGGGTDEKSQFGAW